MWEIWVEWENGSIEMVDEAHDGFDAEHLVIKYAIAYGKSAKRVWKQKA